MEAENVALAKWMFTPPETPSPAANVSPICARPLTEMETGALSVCVIAPMPSEYRPLESSVNVIGTEALALRERLLSSRTFHGAVTPATTPT